VTGGCGRLRPLALLLAACATAEPAPGPPARHPGIAAAESLWTAGDAVYWTGGHDSAHALWTDALAKARAEGDSALVARVLTSLGMAERQLGEYVAARRHGEAALALKLRLRPSPDLFTSYNALGLLAWSEGRLADASRHLDRANALARAANDAEQVAKVANNLALVLTEEGRFTAARAGFAEALAAARTAGVPRLEGNALVNAAMLDIRVGFPERAILALQRARDRYRSVGYAAGEVSALGQLGLARQATGDFHGAFAALDSALALARAHKLRQEEASNLEALADARYLAGDARRALALYREADAIDRELGLTNELGSNLRQTALIYGELGEWAAASRQAAAALEVHQASGAKAEELRDLLLLADLGPTGDAGGAARQLEAAAAVARQLDVRTSRVELALARARHELGRDRAHRALAVLGEVEDDLATGGYDTEWQVADLRAAAWLALGRLESAAGAGRRAVSAIERVRGGVGSGELRTAYLARRVGAYTRLTEVLVRLGRIEEALVIADAMRGRALLEHRLADGAGASLRAGDEGREERLARIGVLAARAERLDVEALDPGDSTARLVRVAARADLARARTEFEAWSAGEGGAAVVPDLGAAHLDARALRRSLDQGEAVLEYLVRPDRLDLFVVTRDTVRHAELRVSGQSLRSRVRLARDLLAEPAATRERAAAVLTGLHQVLITPAERAGFLRGVSHLTIVPHGGLSYLPFAALLNPSSGRFLVQDYVIRLAVSAAVLSARETDAPPAASRAPVMALAPFPTELPGSSAEVLAVRRLQPGSAVWEGDEATERRAREGLGSARIVHFATHATMNTANPLFSRIDLRPAASQRAEDDGRLEVHEILGLRLPGSLVYLSGCETGLGAAWSSPFQLGEDYTTLMQAFLQAGARAAVGTLWRVRDDGASALAEAFYRGLGRASPAAALADAQRALLASPQWVSPYHWAGYAVAGD
jgi:CHAT domain-containing protein/tetratricopeptide (TPR) repeat protein